jgi:hypothetical protein
MAVKADRKQNAKQFNPELLLFKSLLPLQTTCKNNAKDDTRPKPKWRIIAWMKRIVRMKKLSCPTMKTTVTVTTTMCILI